jgi:hypothetical protein
MPVDPPAESAESPPLPELAQGVLDAATLEALHRDYANLCQLLAVLPRAKANNHTLPGQTCFLDEGFAGLRDGTFSGLQVRYRWDNDEWWDTILALPGNQARIVRMRQSEFPQP